MARPTLAPDPALYKAVEAHPEFRPGLYARLRNRGPLTVDRLPWEWSRDLKLGWFFVDREYVTDRVADRELIAGTEGATHVSMWRLPIVDHDATGAYGIGGRRTLGFELGVAVFGADGIDLRIAATTSKRHILRDMATGTWYVPTDTELEYELADRLFLPYAGMGKTKVSNETVVCDTTSYKVRAPQSILEDPTIRMRLNTRRLVSTGR